MVLKMRGAQKAADIGQQLEITGEAARQHLLRLQQDGLVIEERRSAGRGRPSAWWSLTDKGQARFPDTHAALTVELLRSLSRVLGPEAVDRVIADREATTLVQYSQALQGCDELRARLERLAQQRSAEGYMAEVEQDADGHLMLIENHCPICAAASLCQGFCRAEQAVFAQVLGPDVRIERDEHIVSGGRRCTYRVTRLPSP